MLDGTVEGYQSYEEAVAQQPADAAPRPDRAAIDMLYSSGTTGRPEGRQGARRRRSRSASELPGVGGAHAPAVRRRRPTIVYLSPAPLYHAAPLRFCLATHELGGTVVVMEHFDPEQALALIERYRVTHSQWVPTMFVRMLKLPEEVRAALRRVVAAGGHPRRRAVPGPGQAADDRVVGPGAPRVLRRHRGQRLRLLQQRDVAGPPGHGRARPSAARSTSSARTARSCPPGEAGTIYFEGGAHLRVPQRPREDGVVPRPSGAGRRSATSATSTPTASCTSPTARPT